MHTNTEGAPSRRINPWVGSLVLLVVVAIGVWIGRAPTRESALSGALVTTTGAFAMAAFAARAAAGPRWPWWGAAAAMSIPLVAAAAIVPPPAWAEIRSTAWMLPWYLLVMATLPVRSGACDVATRRGGWFLVGSGLVLSLLGVLAPAIASLG